MARSDDPPATGDRIAKLLARAGIASRREVERMVAEGRVALNGVVVDTPATVLASLDGVTVDGAPVAQPEAARLFLYHKPVGLLVTERDPRGRPTIYDRLPADLPRLVPVGRLDLATEGLLLLTTDGGLKRQLELPATGVERAYRARAYGQVTQAQLEELIDGVKIEGVRYGSIDANLERRTGANVWVELVLTEGKNREVRRVLEHLGLQVSRLIRTRYGPFVLGDLPPGEIGEVRASDLATFRQSLGTRRKDETRIAIPSGTASARRPGPSATPAPQRTPVRNPARPAPTGKPFKWRGEAPQPAPPANQRPARTRKPHPGEGRGPDAAKPLREPAGAKSASSERQAPRPADARAPQPASGPRRDNPEAPLASRPARPQRKAGWAKPRPKSGPARPRRPR